MSGFRQQSVAPLLGMDRVRKIGSGLGVTTLAGRTCIGMSTKETKQDREARFSRLYELAYTDVLRFIQRRAGPDHAEDIVHEAFLVAWRRLDDLPAKPGDARAWLFATARNCLLNNQRGQVRQGALAVRVAAQTPTFTDAEADLTHQRIDLAAAWQRLRPEDQEVLALAIWEDLPAAGGPGPRDFIGCLPHPASSCAQIIAPRTRRLPLPGTLAEPLMTE